MQFKALYSDLQGKEREITLSWDSCVAIGYAGRNQAAVKAHVEELVKLGVPAPAMVPSMYWIDPERIASSRRLDVIGNETSGEIEFFCAFDDRGEAYVTIASDHTDRKLETVSVSKAKQGCSKIIAGKFWKLSDVVGHWDSLKLCCEIQPKAGDPWQVYQEGPLSMLLTPDELLERAKKDVPFRGDKISYFSGTIAVSGGKLVYAANYKIKLTDPKLNRILEQEYTVRVLPDRN